jgi:hypothetical protein
VSGAKGIEALRKLMVSNDFDPVASLIFVLVIGLLGGFELWWNARHKARFTDRMASIKNVAIFLAQRSPEEIGKLQEALLLVELNRGWNVVGTYTGASIRLYSDAQSGRFDMVLTDSSNSFSDFYTVMNKLYWDEIGMFVPDSSVDCSTKEGLMAYFKLKMELTPEDGGG